MKDLLVMLLKEGLDAHRRVAWCCTIGDDRWDVDFSRVRCEIVVDDVAATPRLVSDEAQ